ncbi:hypothetical protein QP143_04395 [Streptococcus agalactiae]|nr:hypothetical protein [Streptococcus agalactiae]
MASKQMIGICVNRLISAGAAWDMTQAPQIAGELNRTYPNLADAVLEEATTRLINSAPEFITSAKLLEFVRLVQKEALAPRGREVPNLGPSMRLTHEQYVRWWRAYRAECLAGVQPQLAKANADYIFTTPRPDQKISRAEWEQLFKKTKKFGRRV